MEAIETRPVFAVGVPEIVVRKGAGLTIGKPGTIAAQMGRTPGRMNLGLTLDEVAERLDVHRETVAVWIRKGELRATKLGRGGKYWIAPRDLNRFLKGRRMN